MKYVLTVALLGVAAFAPAASVPATWRLDFYHTGGPNNLEVFSLDKVVLEPLPWPGAPGAAVDRGGFGGYRFEVRATDGRVLFSRGYSPIFAEWMSTEEAAKINRTFHESVRFPAPDAPVDIVIEKRNAKNDFVEAWRTRVDPNDMFIDRSAPPKLTPMPIEHHGEPQDKVDVALIGDGYTAAECGTKFAKDARRMVDALFDVEPFKSRRQDFNVWGLCPPAQQSGISRPSTGVHIASPVGTTYDVFGSERYVLTMDNRAFRTIASWAPYEFAAIMVNSATYGGGGMYGVFSTFAADNDWANYLFIHEFGHHFAGLGDEYFTSPVAYQPPAAVVEPWEPNITALLDPAALKWRTLATPGAPVPTPWPKAEFEAYSRAIQERRTKLRADRRPESEMSALFQQEAEFETKLLASAETAGTVGAFQGANYDAKAFYRPAIDCIMFTRDRVPFCPVCRRAIEQVIDFNARGR